jgi:hypothetical protein
MQTALNILQFVQAKTFFACTAIDERIVERLFMPGVLPNKPVLNDRRVDSFDVVALVNKPVPPASLYVIG